MAPRQMPSTVAPHCECVDEGALRFRVIVSQQSPLVLRQAGGVGHGETRPCTEHVLEWTGPVQPVAAMPG